MSKKAGYKLTAFSLRFIKKNTKAPKRVSGKEFKKKNRTPWRCSANFAFKEIRYPLRTEPFSPFVDVWEKLRNCIRRAMETLQQD